MLSNNTKYFVILYDCTFIHYLWPISMHSNQFAEVIIFKPLAETLKRDLVANAPPATKRMKLFCRCQAQDTLPSDKREATRGSCRANVVCLASYQWRQCHIEQCCQMGGVCVWLPANQSQAARNFRLCRVAFRGRISLLSLWIAFGFCFSYFLFMLSQGMRYLLLIFIW